MRIKCSISFLLLMLLVISCDKGAKTPEGLIQKYVLEITSKKVDRAFFEKHTTGKLLESVNNMDDDEFEDFLNTTTLKKVKNPEIEITNKICSGDKCSVTYIIKFDLVDKKDKEFESEVKKVASVQKEEDIWKISEVTNVKTYIEAQNPINALEQNK